MNTRDLSLYGLVGGEGAVRSIIDTANQEYNTAKWKSHYAWDVQQLGLTFSVLSAQSNIAPMASVIDINADKPLRATSGYSGYGGSIPKIGHGFDIEEQTLRDQQQLVASGGVHNQEAIAELLYNNVNRLIEGAHARVGYMGDQLRSTGKVIIDANNNPDGLLLEISFHVPDENYLKAGFAPSSVKKAWSDPTANPIQDLINMVAYADEHNISYDVFEMSKVLYNQFLFHPNTEAWVRLRMGIETGVAFPIGENDVRTALASYGTIPPIVVNDTKYNAQADGYDNTVKGFNEGNVVLRPSGVIGKVKNAVSMHTLAPSTPDNLRSTIEGGRIAILNQWDARKLINHIELEGYAMPTLANPKNLLILDTTSAAS